MPDFEQEAAERLEICKGCSEFNHQNTVCRAQVNRPRNKRQGSYAPGEAIAPHGAAILGVQMPWARCPIGLWPASPVECSCGEKIFDIKG